MSEFDSEPVHGLPENLPEGEALRWQGAPQWGALAIHAFHVRKVALYFGILILFRFVLLLTGGVTLPAAVMSALWLMTLAVLAIAILSLLAWLYGRSTVYSITDRRLVIRFGIALPMAVNIPFKVIESAGLRRHADGTGDIPLVLGAGQSVNYLIMWPNVRPWRFLNAQPMLRSISNVDEVAEILATALRSAADSEPEEAKADLDEPRDATAGQPPQRTGVTPQLDSAPAASR